MNVYWEILTQTFHWFECWGHDMLSHRNLHLPEKSLVSRKSMNSLTPFLYCLGPRVAKPKKWFFPNFIFKGWEWCIWTITTIIHHQIWSADSTADITVIQSSKLSTLRSTFGRVPLNFFNCSGWNYFNFYIYFWISLKNLTDHDVWPPFWPWLFWHKMQK